MSARETGCDDGADRTIVVVEPAAAEALEVVVVGPAEIHVRVDDGAVGPVVVGVAGDVALRRVDEASRMRSCASDCPRMSSVMIVGGRSGSSAKKAPPTRSTLIFFSSPNTPRPLPTADWRLDVRDALDLGAGLRVDEEAEDVAARGDDDLPDQHVRRAPSPPSRGRTSSSGSRSGSTWPPVSAAARARACSQRERRRGVDRDVGMDGAEDRDRLRAVALAHELRAEDARGAVRTDRSDRAMRPSITVSGRLLARRSVPGVGEAPDLAIPVERRVAARGGNVHRTRRGLSAGRGWHRNRRETERPACERPRQRARTDAAPSILHGIACVDRLQRSLCCAGGPNGRATC